MFERLLGELGFQIDLFIEKIAKWNRGMPWYKIAAYLFTRHKIKNNAFEDGRHFYKFMRNIELNNYLWNWQYRNLIKLYYKHTIGGTE